MNKIILITGASSGIGLSSAILLAKMQYQVIATVRDQKSIHDLKKEMELAEVKFQIETLDVRNEESVKALVSIIKEKYNQIDILINATGYGLAGSIEDTTIEEGLAQFDTNFWGVHRVTKYVLPLMRIKKSGLIINISSGLGREGIPMAGFYCASKFALEGYSESLASEVKPFGIKVVLIEPTETSSTFGKKVEVAVNSFSEHSVYYPNTYNAIKNIRKKTKQDTSPKQVAELILKIIKSVRLKLRYKI